MQHTRSTSVHLSPPHKPDEQHLLTRLRSGKAHPHDLVLFLQPRIKRLATRYSGNTHQVEQEDLVQSANVALLEGLDVALRKVNPFAYSLSLAHFAMLRCLRHSSLIVSHRHDKYEQVTILSLDQPYTSSRSRSSETYITLAEVLAETLVSPSQVSPKQERLYDALTQALDGLPPVQRTVIARHFGLEGYSHESMNAISRSLQAVPSSASSRASRTTPPAQPPTNAHYYKRLALHTLRAHLTEDSVSRPKRKRG